ncbi:receptor-like protein 56 [Manihot esculenta]|uniref:receptor-like protein 56 n=1 Tax=Manihot esculenta TaxID=3983 RepID=UPI001CC63068|nr:receptor-like protein 56 [Manihot esculenta]
MGFYLSNPDKIALNLHLPWVDWDSSEIVEVEFATKYRYNSYKGDIINSMAGIDLSCNELSGSIPQEIGDLHEIRSLNLSHNHITGSIPVSFSNLRSLESLDLGNNNLSGEIPSELVALTFLETFNVSYNNLSGRVPNGAQFGTFDENNYRGNPGLCGERIHKSCKSDEAPQTPPPSADVEEEDEGVLIWCGSIGVSVEPMSQSYWCWQQSSASTGIGACCGFIMLMFVFIQFPFGFVGTDFKQ